MCRLREESPPPPKGLGKLQFNQSSPGQVGYCALVVVGQRVDVSSKFSVVYHVKNKSNGTKVFTRPLSIEVVRPRSAFYCVGSRCDCTYLCILPLLYSEVPSSRTQNPPPQCRRIVQDGTDYKWRVKRGGAGGGGKVKDWFGLT